MGAAVDVQSRPKKRSIDEVEANPADAPSAEQPLKKSKAMDGSSQKPADIVEESKDDQKKEESPKSKKKEEAAAPKKDEAAPPKKDDDQKEKEKEKEKEP